MSSVFGGTANAVASPASVRAIKQRSKTSIAGTSETTIVSAGPAGIFNDLYGVIIANTGAVTTKVDLRDTTGGAVQITLEVPANDTRGFMLPAPSSTDQTGSATNWTAQAASSTNLEITAFFVTNGP